MSTHSGYTRSRRTGIVPQESRMPSSYRSARDLLARETGIVIPVFVSDGMDLELAEMLISDTVSAFCELVADPSRVCISVDGQGPGAPIGQRVGEFTGATVAVSPVNMGKLQGVRTGARLLLSRPEISHLAIADQDGDHFANELINLVRAAEHVRSTSGTDRMLVLV